MEKFKKFLNAENVLTRIKKFGFFTSRFRIIDKKGKVRWISAKYLPVKDNRGEIYRVVRIERDITPFKLYEEKLKKLAKYDFLTGVYNRRAFFQRAESELARSKRLQEKVGIIVIDIDDFKKINDNYGHEAGDKVLREFAGVLKNMCRKYDFVARFGGEEFVIFLSKVDENMAVKIAERIREDVEKRMFHLSRKNIEIKLTASFGVAVLEEEDNYSVEKIIQRADEALYRAKNSGKNKTVFLQ